jgi:hypothetical protein
VLPPPDECSLLCGIVDAGACELRTFASTATTTTRSNTAKAVFLLSLATIWRLSGQSGYLLTIWDGFFTFFIVYEKMTGACYAR